MSFHVPNYDSALLHIIRMGRFWCACQSPLSTVSHGGEVDHANHWCCRKYAAMHRMAARHQELHQFQVVKLPSCFCCIWFSQILTMPGSDRVHLASMLWENMQSVANLCTLAPPPHTLTSCPCFTSVLTPASAGSTGTHTPVPVYLSGFN